MTMKVEQAPTATTFFTLSMGLEDAFALLGAHEEGDTLQDSRAGNELLRALREATKPWRFDADLNKVVPRSMP